MECDCDGEDHGGNVQPPNCSHLDPGADRCEADIEEMDDDAEYGGFGGLMRIAPE